MTQKQRVMLYLETLDAVCVYSVPRDLGYTLRNRISELARDGVRIEKHRYRAHGHRSTVMAYVLVREGQQEMALA